MASLSVNIPWQSMLAGHLPELQAGLSRDYPGLSLLIVTGENVLSARVDTDGPSPADAAFVTASYLAPIWPALLTEHGVEFEVRCGGSSWTSSPGAMARLAGGRLAREAWLYGAVFTECEA